MTKKVVRNLGDEWKILGEKLEKLSEYVDFFRKKQFWGNLPCMPREFKKLQEPRWPQASKGL